MNIAVMIYSRQYRMGTMTLLEPWEGIVPIDLGDGGEESIRRLTRLSPQALLVDLPRGRLAAILHSVHGDYPALPILAVNCEEGVAELLALFEAGLTWQNSTDPRCPSAEGLGSPWGPHVDLSAPGGNRIATTERVATGSYYELRPAVCRYAWRSGTAGATAAVAGTAALLRSYALILYGEDIAQILERTAQDFGVVGRDDFFGNGVVDAAAAIAFVDNASVIDQGATSNTLDLGVVDTPDIFFNDVPPPAGADTWYETRKHEVRADIQFTHPFVSAPAVWGRKAHSVGWRSHPDNDSRFHLEEPAGWAEVVPGSVTREGCTLRTYVYAVTTTIGTSWYPAAPNQVTLAWTAIGPANPTAAPTSESPRALSVAASPNPVSRSGEFSLTLPEASQISLRLFRVDGTLVRELAKGAYPAGVHRIPWDANGLRNEPLSAGVYFYQMSTRFGSRGGKILVLK